MTLPKSLTVRVSPPWLHMLGRLLNVVHTRERGDRGRLLRELVHREAMLWLQSPYTIADWRHFILVLANGDMYYHSIEQVELRSDRERLPSMLSMKPEKRDQFLSVKGGGARGLENLRAHWMVNHFAVWQGEDRAAEPLAALVDPSGTSVKCVDLPINQPAGTPLTREVVVGISDYVQRKSEIYERDLKRVQDRGCVSIAVPTKHLDLRLLVDLDLYRHSGFVATSATAGYEFRNPENARLAETRIQSEDNPIDWTEDRFPDAKYRGPEYEPTLEAIQESFNDLAGRLAHLAAEGRVDSADHPVVRQSGNRKKLRSLRLPERFFFGRLRWPMPFRGLKVCMTWNKPA